ncbi:MAG: GyrI-like domain-containing protein, partial [Anaerolineae bacterium]|nr:GyrI-like domain-containing protein [Anaerolineae bacterium]
MVILDLRKDLKHLYNPSAKEFAVVDVPPMNFLMIDGSGNPNTSPEYQEVMNVLYSVAYTLKFALKKGRSIDYPVMPLEGLWWAQDMEAFTLGRKDDWLWTMMIMQPEPVTSEDIARALAEVRKKKDLPALARLRFEPYHEGLSVQIMYFGPYSAEGPTIARMHEFIQAQGYEPAGKHHEIYLGDPRRAAPEKLKTVIRQPVRP